MSNAKINAILVLCCFVFVALACRTGNNSDPTVTGNSSAVSTNPPKQKTSDTLFGDDDIEKVKPASGKGNVQGKVLFNDQPVEGIEVKICGSFSTVMGVECKGKTATAKTDKDGVFVLANLEPMQYQGLTAKVFKSNYYIYPIEGIMTPQKFNVEADRTIFANDVHLFKDDIKIVAPKAGTKVDANGVELKWNAYPDAAYYKVSLTAEDSASVSPVNNERVEDTTYAIDEPLTNGKYTIRVQAFNDNDRKLAESADDIKFTVTGGAEPESTN